MANMRSALSLFGLGKPRSGVMAVILPEALAMAVIAFVVSVAFALPGAFGQRLATALPMVAVMMLAYFIVRMVALRVETAQISREREATYKRSLRLNDAITRSFQRPD